GKSSLMFRIKHIIGYVVGKFEKFEGAIALSEKDDALKSLSITIDVGSVNSKQKDRDADLKSDRFFDVAKYPEAKFVSKSVEKDQVKGDLTLHGVTKEVTLKYKLYPGIKDDAGKVWTGLSLEGTINRKDFGITYNEKTDDGGMLLGDDVGLKIHFLGE